MLKIAWLFITCVIGTAQLSAVPQQPKPKIMPITWLESLAEIKAL